MFFKQPDHDFVINDSAFYVFGTNILKIFIIRLFCKVLLLFAVPGMIFAQSVAKFAGEFLAIGVGARPQALGTAFAALADDGTATYWNPAGIGQLKQLQVSVMHAEQFAGEVNYDFASLVLPFQKKSTFGISVVRLGIDGIPDTRNALIDTIQSNGRIDEGERLNVDAITFFSNTDYAFYFSYAHEKSSSTYFGTNVKVIRRNIGDNSAWGIGFDAGFLSHIGDFSYGANLMDVTSTVVAWDTGKRELISPTVKIGSAYTFSTSSLPFTIIPVFDSDIRFENRRTASRVNIGSVSLDFHYGLELKYRSLIAIRVGFDDIKRIAFGLGVHLKQLVVDYAFTSFDDFNELGNSHRLSLSFDIRSNRFGRQQTQRPVIPFSVN